MIPMFINAVVAPIAMAATLATATVEVGEQVAVFIPDLSEVTAPGPAVSRRAIQPQDTVTPPDMAEVTGVGPQ